MQTTHDLIKAYLRSLNFSPMSIKNYSVKDNRILLNFTEGKKEEPKSTTIEMPLLEYITFLFNEREERPQVKPILLVTLYEQFDNNQYKDIQYGLDELTGDDYYPIVLVDSRKEEIEFKVFYDKDFNEAKYEEIKSYIKEQMND